MRLEAHRKQAKLIHVLDVHAEFFALLIDAVESGFVDEVGDSLVGHERAGRQRSDGGQVELPAVAQMGDEKSALVYDQRGSGVALLEQLLEDVLELADVFLAQLGKRSHVMRIEAGTG